MIKKLEMLKECCRLGFPVFARKTGGEIAALIEPKTFAGGVLWT